MYTEQRDEMDRQAKNIDRPVPRSQLSPKLQ